MKELGKITSLRIDSPPMRGRQHAEFETEDGERGCGYLRATHDGQPMQPGERLIDVHPPGPDGKQDVRELYASPRGPRRVTSNAYREGYDVCFGKKDVRE